MIANAVFKIKFCSFLQQVTLQEAKLLLKEDDDLIRDVFEYWSRKRKLSKSGSLIPTIKQEKRDGSSTNDPYVAFRRRTEKMQTRKVNARTSGPIDVLFFKADPAVQIKAGQHGSCSGSIRPALKRLRFIDELCGFP